ncbi:MAG: Spy/CpxP family protein refolding chaperone [Vicinamibacterales bacterium]
MALSSRVFVRLLAVIACLTAVTAAPAFAQGFKWWQNERYQRELNLAPEQVSRLEDIYQAAGPAMRTEKAALERRQADLSAMVDLGQADEVDAAGLIARVEGARAELGRTRALMLYRMRRVLTTEQHGKLKALFAERERSRRSRPQDQARR